MSGVWDRLACEVAVIAYLPATADVGFGGLPSRGGYPLAGNIQIDSSTTIVKGKSLCDTCSKLYFDYGDS